MQVLEVARRFATVIHAPLTVVFHADDALKHIDKINPSIQFAHTGENLDRVRKTPAQSCVVVMKSTHDKSTWLQVFNALQADPTLHYLWIDLAIDPSEETLPRHMHLHSLEPMSTAAFDFVFRPLRAPAYHVGRIVAAEVMQFAKDLVSTPLQLALVVLRLTQYDPNVFKLYLPIFKKKMPLLTTSRQFNNLLTGLHRVLLWAPTCPDILDFFDKAANSSPSTSANKMLFAHVESTSSTDDHLKPLSQSMVWSAQQEFYKAQGIQAWSSNLIPYGVSSSMFIAQAYARVVFQFFADCHRNDLLPTEPEVNCYVLEGGSGSCKFAAAFVRELLQLLKEVKLTEDIRPCVILTDLSEQVVESRRQHPSFQNILQLHPHAVDFAVMDCQAVVNKEPVYLRLANEVFQPAKRPVFLVGNYFLDSLPTDAFMVDSKDTYQVLTDDRADVFYPRLLNDLNHYYDDASLDKTLQEILEHAQTLNRKSLILFPVQAFHFLAAIHSLSTDSPIGMLFGDATVHFSDNLHDIPELSPHAECFCLPVDFEIVQNFIAKLLPSAQVSSTLQMFSDTFQVFYASLLPDQPSMEQWSHFSFDHELKGFGANDCDLVLGSLHDSRGFTSLDPQIAFLSLSNYDFDCFLIFKWQLVAALRLEPNRDPNSVVQVGLRCYKNLYTLDLQPEFNLQLSMARWLYALKSYEACVEILKTLLPSKDTRVLYLLGLSCMHLGALEKASLLFSSCMRIQFKRKFEIKLRLCIEQAYNL
ncbi:hypothetical protein LEN26_013934 [Aphanomyces euteiches]|nr:hypothetical protein LEN26_013934 [Aphanomyces euteiches]KAH9184126.1 hypothetical protein AeNC1_013900 [Aphanomyces euteiches]